MSAGGLDVKIILTNHFHGRGEFSGDKSIAPKNCVPMSRSRIATIAIPMACALAVTFAAQPHARAQGKPTWGKILIADGPSDSAVDLYDPTSNRFASKLETPRMKSRCRATGTLLVAGPNAGKVLLAGGDNRNDVARASTELYDPATNTVVDGPSMKSPRSGHTATVIPSGPNAGKILFAGGMGADGGELASTELYDPATNNFSPGPAMLAACALGTATQITSGKKAGRILIAGATIRTAWWVRRNSTIRLPMLLRPGPIMHPARVSFTATVVPSGKNAGKILIAGGTQLGGDDNNDSTQLYDQATDKFVRGPAMKPARDQPTATAIASGPNAGKILIAGGERDDKSETGRDVSLVSTEIYDPDTNTVSPGPPMNTRRGAHSATVILSGKNAGKILIAGGMDKDADKNGGGVTHSVSSTELYDPVTNTFAPGPNMNCDHLDAVAIQLPPAP
jgi:hypothetical protein